MRHANAEVASPVQTDLTVSERMRMAGNRAELDSPDCSIEIHMGCFFDGTRNNRYDSIRRSDNSETNVARLFNVFDVRQKSGYSQRTHLFRSYIQGVGTSALQEVGDAGIGLHASAGAAAGWAGEGRINWMLMQLQDHLHRHYLGATLTEAMGTRSASLVRSMSTDMRLPRQQMERLANKAKLPLDDYLAIKDGTAEIDLRSAAAGMRNALSNVFNVQNAIPDDLGRFQVLQGRREELARRVAPFAGNKPRVARIRLSVFGFSRGSAEARVFCNWLTDACDPGSSDLRLCGIPLQIDFVGLFDTVASVGAAQSFSEHVFDGHGGWARADDLRIPPYVRRCVHMVAAHEVRGSFPLDLVDGPQCEQIVYPGVHSDVGGGYVPGEQGRSPQDADKLSQIPLCDMYRAALSAGVPLLSMSDALPEHRKQFKVSDNLRRDFNAYIQTITPLMPSAASAARADRTTAFMYAHYRQFLLWRSRHIDDFHTLPAYVRASAQDQMDLLGANEELRSEVKGMTHNNARARLRSVSASTYDYGSRGHSDTKAISDSLQMLLRGEKERQWLDVHIGRIWNSGMDVPAAIGALLDGYIHDSRAWFKPFGEDDDQWVHNKRREAEQYTQRMRALERRIQANEQAVALAKKSGNGYALQAHSEYITVREYEELAEWRRNPNPPLALQEGQREFFWQWGYLRWRTTYMSAPGQPASVRAAVHAERRDAADMRNAQEVMLKQGRERLYRNRRF